VPSLLARAPPIPTRGTPHRGANRTPRHSPGGGALRTRSAREGPAPRGRRHRGPSSRGRGPFTGVEGSLTTKSRRWCPRRSQAARRCLQPLRPDSRRSGSVRRPGVRLSTSSSASLCRPAGPPIPAVPHQWGTGDREPLARGGALRSARPGRHERTSIEQRGETRGSPLPLHP
jgi:hypothetical protein